MYKLFIIKTETDNQRVIFNDIVKDLEIETYSDSIETNFLLHDVEFKISYNKKDNIKMSIELV